MPFQARYIICFEFLGDNFFGSQKQPDKRTVQGEIETVLKQTYKPVIAKIYKNALNSLIADNSKFLSYYSQLSNTEKGLITGVRANNPQDVSGTFINAAMISSKCTERQAKLKFASIYDYVIHVENVKGIGFRVDSVMEVVSTKNNPLVMNEIVKFVDGLFVLDLPAEFVSQKSSASSAVVSRPAKSLRARLKSS